jgi:hypothetical protein
LATGENSHRLQACQDLLADKVITGPQVTLMRVALPSTHARALNNFTVTPGRDLPWWICSQ